jgi:transcriptional regulator with XRE-family HTH domain
MDEQELQQRFGQKAARLRRKAGKTQGQLAGDSGISAHMIARIEGGKTGVRFPNIVKLANALDVDPGELFSPDHETGPISMVTMMMASLNDADARWVSELVKLAIRKG